jgi:ppGpp synthetase/RelA/SpoT-type nucleotidyltranferase
MDLDKFLTASRITREEWIASDAAWDDLQAIAKAHDARRAALTHAAEMLASRLQALQGVHSVRWRVKDTTHLLEKIVRKKIGKTAKYLDINPANYAEVVRDLVGVRALHLFKEDEDAIDEAIRDGWALAADEDVILYSHPLDQSSQTMIDRGAKPVLHDKGYRSNHYIIEMRPDKHTVYVEVQVRTIFAEAWSEIDHKVRYPNFVDDEQIDYFLAIFNSLAVNADAMGSFVKGLTISLQEREDATAAAVRDRDTAMEKMEEALAELQQVKDGKAEAAVTVMKDQYALMRHLIQKEKIRESSKKHSNLRGSVQHIYPTSIVGGDLNMAFQGLEGIPGINTSRKKLPVRTKPNPEDPA